MMEREGEGGSFDSWQAQEMEGRVAGDGGELGTS